MSQTYYPLSQHIDVFPVSDHRDYRPQNLTFSELTLTTLFKAFADVDKCVVTKDYIAGNQLTFFIDGYLFTLDDTAVTYLLNEAAGQTPTEETHIWAFISYDKRSIEDSQSPNALLEYKFLMGEENIESKVGSDGTPTVESVIKYTGVGFVKTNDSTEPTDIDCLHKLQEEGEHASHTCEVKKLNILVYRSGKWVVPNDSMYRLSTNSIQNIDGGIV